MTTAPSFTPADPARAADTSSAAAGAPHQRIERARLDTLLDERTCNWSIEIVEQTGSTNADLTTRLREHRTLAAPLVRLAYRQSAGRGRRGRSWVAEPGDALLFSLAYPMQRPLDGLGGLSLAIGTAIMAGLRALPQPDAAGSADLPQLGLKWPNDILLGEAKLGGVLIETAWSTAEMSAVVIGIGLNLRGATRLAAQLAELAGAADAPAAAPTGAAALDQRVPDVDITATLAHLLNALADTLARFEQAGFAAFRELWLSDHAYAGRAVSLLENGVTVASGTAESVDALGQLLIATPQGLHTCAAGDVSLRLRAALRTDGR